YLSGVFRPPTSTVPIVSRLASSVWAEPAPPFLTAAMSASRSALVAYRRTITVSGIDDLPAAPPARTAVPAYVSPWASATRPVNAKVIATSTQTRRLEWFSIATPVGSSRAKYQRRGQKNVRANSSAISERTTGLRLFNRTAQGPQTRPNS